MPSRNRRGPLPIVLFFMVVPYPRDETEVFVPGVSPGRRQPSKGLHLRQGSAPGRGQGPSGQGRMYVLDPLSMMCRLQTPCVQKPMHPPSRNGDRGLSFRPGNGWPCRNPGGGEAGRGLL